MRHQLRAHLASLGFGNIGTALWIAPARMHPAARAAPSPNWTCTLHCAVFVGDYVAARISPRMVCNSWDLDDDRPALPGVHRATTRPRRSTWPARAVIAGEQAFDQPTWPWSTTGASCRSATPGCPARCCAEDWSGPAAVQLFERLVAMLEGRALAHAAPYWSAAPKPADTRAGAGSRAGAG